MKTCNKEGCYNPVFGGGYCKLHQYLRKDKKPSKLIRKTTGELQMFKDIFAKLNPLWPVKPCKCEISGANIDYYIREQFPSCFAHVIPKAMNKYPLFKLYDHNIVIVHPQVHTLWDNHRTVFHDSFESSFITTLELDLKNQYQTFSQLYRPADLKGMDHIQVTDLIIETIRQYDNR